MRGVVYVDVLVLVNAILGYFLLRCTACAAALPARPGRMCAAAFLSGLSALVLLWPQLPWGVSLAVKLAGVLLTLAAAFCPCSVRAFCRAGLWGGAFTAALGGLAAAAVFWGAGSVEYRNFAVYIHISPILLIACILGMYAAVELAALVFGRPQPGQRAAFAASVAGAGVRGTALLDTGLHVRDTVTGAQAVLLSLPQVRTQLPPGVAGALDDYFAGGALAHTQPPLCLMPVKTAAGTRALPALRAQQVRVQPLAGPPGRARCADGVLLVFSAETFADGGFCAMMNPELLWER